MMHRLNERIFVSAALDATDLRELGAAGVRGVIDLRSDGEPRPRGIPPWDEATAAHRLGLAHRQIPVEPQLLCDALAHQVAGTAARMPAPVLIHCTSGRRAGTFGLALLACDEDLTVDDCLARGRDLLGLDFESMPRLTAFLRHFVERHGRHYRGTDQRGVIRRTGSG